eukprot:9339661-Lingulodinium_polyedra.AAC.1
MVSNAPTTVATLGNTQPPAPGLKPIAPLVVSCLIVTSITMSMERSHNSCWIWSLHLDGALNLPIKTLPTRKLHAADTAQLHGIPCPWASRATADTPSRVSMQTNSVRNA